MRNIFKKRGNLSSISTIISLSLVLFVIGILALALINAKQFTDKIKEEGIVFTIMLHDSTDNASEEMLSNQRKEFKNYLEGSGYFLDVKFIHKDIAYKELQKEVGEDLSSVLEVNPLRDSYDAHVKAKFVSSDGLKQIESFIEKFQRKVNENDIVLAISQSGETADTLFVKDIFYQEKIVEEIDLKTSKASLFLLPFCAVFLLISFALINNAIRLSIYSKRLLIRTMRLVGATNIFIQKPYLISSIYQGFFSSIISIFMIIGSVEFLKEIIPELIQPNDFLEIAVIFGLILIFGIIISWISTFFAVRRYLNLNENELFN